MQAAEPEYISLAIIAEEGLDYNLLQEITNSIAKSSQEAGCIIVTGDFKTVEKGACDKIFITTSGVGRILKNRSLDVKNIEAKDKIIITGDIAQHGLSVLTARKDLNLGFKIKSDCAALNRLLIPALKKTDAIKFMRDPTRGGVATVLNEIARATKLGIFIEEEKIPLAHKTKIACELLGLDPLYLANEGRAVIVVRNKNEKKVLSLIKRHPLGRNARVVGEVSKAYRSKVVLKTIASGERILDMVSGDPLPRIC
jgi:hydrogenase expression/formation protein HypE